MTRHPMLLSLLLLDGIILMLLFRAGIGAFRILVKWSPGSYGREQLILEKTSEAVSIDSEWLARFQGLAIFGLAVSISLVLPELVPGAMCGTGVFQATDGYGSRAIGLRVLAFGLIYARVVVDRIDRSHETGVLTLLSNRILLLSIPVYLAALVDTIRAAVLMEGHAPVQCCSTVYGFLELHPLISEPIRMLPDRFWLIAYLVTGAGLIVTGMTVFRYRRPGGRAGMLLAVVGVLWTGIALVTLSRVLTPYYYGVLQHDCLWCLLLPEHWMAGFPLYFLLLVVLMESPVALLAAAVAKRYPSVESGGQHSHRMAGLKVAISATVFILLSILPALIWRLRFGVWIG